jgi:hypothetical protein
MADEGRSGLGDIIRQTAAPLDSSDLGGRVRVKHPG